MSGIPPTRVLIMMTFVCLIGAMLFSTQRGHQDRPTQAPGGCSTSSAADSGRTCPSPTH